MRGMNKFRTFFAEFSNNYVIIGGTACDFYEEHTAKNRGLLKI